MVYIFTKMPDCFEMAQPHPYQENVAKTMKVPIQMGKSQSMFGYREGYQK